MTAEGVTGPTPEEAAELPSRVIGILVGNQERIRKFIRNRLTVVVIALVLGIGYNSWQSHGANDTATKIRNSQVTNTRVTSHRLACLASSNRILALDLKFALTVPAGISRQQFIAGLKIPPIKC